MLWKPFAIAALAFLAAATGLWFALVAEKARSSALAKQLVVAEAAVRAAETARRASERALVRRSAQRISREGENAANRRRLDAATSENPTWADQPVPKEVQDALKAPDTAGSGAPATGRAGRVRYQAAPGGEDSPAGAPAGTVQGP